MNRGARCLDAVRPRRRTRLSANYGSKFRLNTDGPHLHFGINDGRNPLISSSLPFEIDRLRFECTAAVGPTPGELTLVGKAHDERRSHPLVTSVSDYLR